MNNKYTSIELSKKFAEAGFDKEYQKVWLGYIDVNPNKDGDMILEDKKEAYRRRNLDIGEKYPAYDILNDLCVKYAKELFGEKDINPYDLPGDLKAWIIHTEKIFFLMQYGKKQKAEQYFLKHCKLFNKESNK